MLIQSNRRLETDWERLPKRLLSAEEINKLTQGTRVLFEGQVFGNHTKAIATVEYVSEQGKVLITLYEIFWSSEPLSSSRTTYAQVGQLFTELA